MAVLHLIFYVPLACVRLGAQIANVIGAPQETILAFQGASFVGYNFSSPAHVANFIVRCVRVPGFTRAVLRVCLLAPCPCARVCGSGSKGIDGPQVQSAGAMI